jgi:dTDP-4-amino-4,6-dideoxygalactose transaminase
MLLSGLIEDEVLTQALTFVATCNAISYIGAQPFLLMLTETPWDFLLPL